MSTDPWTGGVLARKDVELISVALNAACTNLNSAGTRRHIRAALVAGASRDELLLMLKMASAMALHSCAHGVPILVEEARAAGLDPGVPRTEEHSTLACDKMRAAGQWNEAWNPFVELDPEWTDAYMAVGVNIYGSGLISPKLTELISVALDASFTHMYAPGTRRHIRAALKLGATPRQIMEVLKLCAVQGVESCNLGIPILADELQRFEAATEERK